MRIEIAALRKSPVIKHFVNQAKTCTVVLSTGKEVEIDKTKGTADVEQPLTATEKKEYNECMKLMEM